MKCQGIKKDGGRCMNTAQKEVLVCWVHREQEAGVAAALRNRKLGWHNVLTT